MDGTGDWQLREDLWRGHEARKVLSFPWLGETTFWRKRVNTLGKRKDGEDPLRSEGCTLTPGCVVGKVDGMPQGSEGCTLIPDWCCWFLRG